MQIHLFTYLENTCRGIVILLIMPLMAQKELTIFRICSMKQLVTKRKFAHIIMERHETQN